MLGLTAAAYVEATLSADSFGSISEFGIDVLLVTVIAVPSYVCAASATPLAAVLLVKGFSPGAVLVGLLLGPATNVATVGFLRHEFGGRATWVALGTFVAATWLAAVLINLAPVDWVPSGVMSERAHSHGVVAWVATAILGVVALKSLWSSGLAGWLGVLGEGSGHGHGHAAGGPGHGHSH